MSEEIRVGVFVCDCGSNIAGFVDVPGVVEYARTLPDVAFADEGRWSCSVDYLTKLQNAVKEQKLNRVVIASCTPRTHEPLFKNSVREAGLNPYLLEFVSIREQVSWVHMHDREAATLKAKEMVKMGVAKARLLEEGHEIQLPVGQDAMIIGGGIAGMNAALAVAKQGFKAYLVERKPELGGLLKELAVISGEHGEMPAADILKERVSQVEADPNVTVYTDCTIEAVEGYIGNYKVKLKLNGGSDQNVDLNISTIVVATGMEEIAPEGLFLYGEDDRVITLLQLEKKLKENAISGVGDTVFISCVNSKNEQRGCCNIGCHVSVKDAVALKKANPDSKVYICYRDMSLIREEHFAIDAAKQAGVKFLRFPDAKYPEVSKADGKLMVKVQDILSGREFELPADLLVLATAFKGNETVQDIKGQLKVSASADGFFQERHIKLGPVDFAADGLALAGCAKNPKTFKESCEESLAAAMRVSIPMANGHIEAEGIVADIDLTDCTKCGLCAKKCPYGAIRLSENKEPQVIKALCKGCGLCAADCPSNSIQIVHFSDEQILAAVEAALEDNPEKKILGFICHWCAHGGVDMAGVSRLQYPPVGRMIRVMCSARVSIKMIERAFELGAAGVLVAGCEFPTCHYISGNYECEKRINRAKKKLAKKGYDVDKLWLTWCSAADGPKYANTMREMAKQLGLS